MVCVTRHGWVPAVNGRIKPQAFMEPMMRHFGHRYYLAGLSAAARHGASHQALFVDHFATSGHLSSRTIRGMTRNRDVPTDPMLEYSRQIRSANEGLERPPAADRGVNTQRVAVFDLFALHPFRGCDAKETVACELLDPGPHRPPGARR